MVERLVSRLSYGNVMSTIALFVALGGVSYAATSLPPNSVGAAQLKRNAVNSLKVANRSLRAVDFARGQLPAGLAGPAGPAGSQGAPGPKGDSGANGATHVVVRSAFFSSGEGRANCNAGEVATGGGVTPDIPGLYAVAKDEPAPNAGTPTGWLGVVRHFTSGTSGPGTVYVVCASP
jgi:hypothetical protein